MQPILNLNDLAAEVTQREGGEESQSIAQIKETIRILSDIFAEMGVCRFLGLAWRMRCKGKERRKSNSRQLFIDFK